MKILILFFLLLWDVACCSLGTAQWRCTQSFPEGITTIQNNEFTRRLFVGLESGQLFYSEDGISWNRSSLNNSKRVNSACFKDSLTGWVATGFDDDPHITPSIYFTTDGGVSWMSQGPNGACNFVEFLTSTQTLVAGFHEDGVYLSKDMGMSWTPLFPGLAISLCHVNSKCCVITGGSHKAEIFRTDDGGISWSRYKVINEMWQPVVVPCTGEILGVSEAGSSTLHSTDSGKSWEDFGVSSGTTGCVQWSDGKYYKQTSNSIDISEDQGHTWREFGGPGNKRDTKFLIQRGVIYAGSDDGSIWIDSLPESKVNTHELHLDTIYLPTTSCTSVSTTLNLLDRFCSPVGLEAQAVVSGKEFFALSSTEDGYKISYFPIDSEERIGKLKVRVQFNSSIIDTVLILKGKSSAITPGQLSIEIDSIFKLGDIVKVRLNSSHLNQNDTSLEFSLIYDPLLLDYLGLVSDSSCQVSESRLNDSTIRIRLEGMLQELSQLLASIKFQVRERFKEITEIAIVDPVLNQSLFCRGWLDDKITLRIQNDCITRLLDSISEHADFRITNVSLDKNMLSVETAGAKGPLEYELYEVRGALVAHGSFTSNQIVLNSELKNGLFILRTTDVLTHLQANVKFIVTK